MLEAILILGGAGLVAWWVKSRSKAVSAPVGMTPPGLPSPPQFVTTSLPGAGGATVAAFNPAIVPLMAQALAGWRVQSSLGVATNSSGGDSFFSIGPQPSAFPDVLSAAKGATLAGLNVYLDADAAAKLSGDASAPSATESAVFMAFAKGIPAIADGTEGEQTAMTPAQAQEALDLNFDGSRFVLFLTPADKVV